MNLPAPTDYIRVFKTTTRAQWDVATPTALCLLGLIGVFFIYSAQFSDPSAMHASLFRQDWFKQIIYLGLGGALYITVSLLDYRFWLSVAHWLYAASIVPLVVVLIPLSSAHPVSLPRSTVLA